MSQHDLQEADVESFLLSPAPRSIPPSIWKASSPSITLKYALTVASLLICIGLLLSWFFIPVHVVEEWRLKQGPAEIVTGKILTEERTQSKSNGSHIYQYTYQYRTIDGKNLKGKTYTTGSIWSRGRNVDVSYFLSDPSVSLPHGGRMDEFGKGALFILIVPALGIFSIFKTLWETAVRKDILTNGTFAKVRVSSVEKFFLYRFDSRPNSKVPHTVSLIHSETFAVLSKTTSETAEVDFLKGRLQTHKSVKVLHLPGKPKQFLLPETWHA